MRTTSRRLTGVPHSHTHFPLDGRTDLSENGGFVKGAEFERRIQKLARRKKVTCQFVADKGKGSHGRLYFGGEFTTPQGSEERNRPRPTGDDVPGSEYRSA
jgi:hypothetical protein